MGHKKVFQVTVLYSSCSSILYHPHQLFAGLVISTAAIKQAA